MWGSRRLHPQGRGRSSGNARQLLLVAGFVLAATLALGLAAPDGARAWKTGAHWAVACKVRDSLPVGSRIRTAMENQPQCVAWGSNGPDIAGCVYGIAVDRAPWFDAYHYEDCGAYARRLLQDALASGDDRQIAFAAGWLTHVVGDMAVHGILVNPECGVYISAKKSGIERHGVLEGWADPVVWRDPAMGGLNPDDYRPVSGGGNQSTRMYRLFVGNQGFGTLTAPGGYVLESLVDRVNHEVFLDPGGSRGGTGFLRDDPFGPGDMRDAEKIFGEVLSAGPSGGLVSWNAMGTTVDYLRKEKLHIYSDYDASVANLNAYGVSAATGAALDTKRIDRVRQAWAQSVTDSSILLGATEWGDYSQFLDSWVLDKGVDGRGVGSLNVIVKTGTEWYSWLDGPGTNHYAYFGMQYDDGTTNEWRLEHPGYDDMESGDDDIYYLDYQRAIQPWHVTKIWMRLGTDCYGPDPFGIWNMRSFSVEMNNQTIYRCSEWNHFNDPGTPARTAEWTSSIGHLDTLTEAGWPSRPDSKFNPITRPVGDGVAPIVRNRNFNDWANGLPSFWSVDLSDSVDQNALPGASAGISTPAGGNSLFLSARGGWGALGYARVGQRFLVTGGQRYRTTVLAKQLLADPDRSAVRMYLEFLDAHGTSLSTSQTSLASWPEDPATGWAEMQVGGTAPATATSARVSLYAESAAPAGGWGLGNANYVAFDDVELARSRLIGGSLESYSGDVGEPDGWRAWFWYPGDVTYGRVTRHTDGQFGWQLRGTGLLDEIGQDVLVTPGQNYRASVDASSGTPSAARLLIRYLDSAGALVTRVQAAGDTFGVNAAGFKTMSVTGVAPTGAVVARVCLASAGLGSVVTFDNVRFTPYAKSAVTMTSSRGTVKGGGVTILSVRCVNAETQALLPGRNAVIEARNGTSWAVVGSFALVGGVATYEFSPPRTMYFRVRVPGDESVAEATTGTLHVDVVASLTRLAVPKTARAGKAFRVSVVLAPTHAAGSRPVRLQRSLYTRGKWLVRKAVAMKAADYAGLTKCSAKLTLARGKWKVRVLHPRDSGALAGVTAWKRVVVR